MAIKNQALLVSGKQIAQNFHSENHPGPRMVFLWCSMFKV